MPFRLGGTMFSLSAFALSACSMWGGIILPPSPSLTTQATACLDYKTATSVCSAAFSGALTTASNSDTLSFTDVASADFGILHVATNSSFSVNNNQAWSYGYVGFADTLTINSATLQGQTGTLNLAYFIDGSVYDSGQSSAFLQVITRVYTNLSNPSGPSLQNYVRDFTYNTGNPNPTNYSQTVPLVFSFTYGQPFELYFSMQATNGTVNDSGTGYNTVARNGSGSGYANFANTLVLTGLQTDDPNATFQAASPAIYSEAGILPEPSTVALCGFGLAALGYVKRRRII